MKKKLQSQCGMSLVFALLIFLLCGVVASVVLSAATTATGRLSEITEMDRRYYSVTSAAELFHEAVEKEGTVSIQRTKTTTTTSVTTYTYHEDETVSIVGPLSSVDIQYGAAVDAMELPAGSQTTMMQDFALYMLFGADGYAGAASWDRSVFNPAVERSMELTLRLESDEAALEGEMLAALTVDVVIELKRDGTLEMLFSDTGDEDTYSLCMTFAADVTESRSEMTESTGPTVIQSPMSNSITSTLVTVKTEVKHTSIRWIMTDMQKVVSSHDDSSM